MNRVVVFIVIGVINLSSVSLTVQVIYKNYFCTYEQAYLEVAGKSITMCGTTCDLDFIDSNDLSKRDSGSGFSYISHIPPIFFCTHQELLFFNPEVQSLPIHNQISKPVGYTTGIFRPPIS